METSLHDTICVLCRHETISVSFASELLKRLGNRKAHFPSFDGTLKFLRYEGFITIVVISPGFRKHCWSRFCNDPTFKDIIDGKSPSSYVPVFLSVKGEKPERPKGANLQYEIEFSDTNYQSGDSEVEKLWDKLKQVLIIKKRNSI